MGPNDGSEEVNRAACLHFFTFQVKLDLELMIAFLAMGVSTTADSSGYFLRLPDLWSIFVVPLVCIYLVLAIWVFRKVRSALSVPPSSPSISEGEARAATSSALPVDPGHS
jgi:hypothetical protein